MEIYIVVPRPAYPPCSLRVGGLKRSHILSIFGLIKIMWIYSWGRPLWLHFYLWKGHVWEGDLFFTYFWAKVLLFLAGKKHLYIRGHIFHGYSYLWVVECWVDYYIFYICVFSYICYIWLSFLETEPFRHVHFYINVCSYCFQSLRLFERELRWPVIVTDVPSGWMIYFSHFWSVKGRVWAWSTI